MDQATESPSGTVIRTYLDPPIIDQFSNEWRLSRSGQVVVDGVHDRTTSGVQEMHYLNRAVWQYTDARLWWYKTSPLATWLPVAGTPNAPFGSPGPDPRIQTLQTSVDVVAAQMAASFGLQQNATNVLQEMVTDLPRRIEPDPRIDALAGSLAVLSALVSSNQQVLLDAVGTAAELALSWHDMVLERLGAIDAAIADNAAKQVDAAAQLERVIVMLLDLFPDKPKPKIVIGSPTFTSQPAPIQSGP
jgi:hypothetical protein